MSDLPKLTQRDWDALADAEKYRAYHWKPASMAKLMAHGFVEPCAHADYASGYAITASGRGALQARRGIAP